MTADHDASPSGPRTTDQPVVNNETTFSHPNRTWRTPLLHVHAIDCSAIGAAHGPDGASQPHC
jgi:hypothetical protein